MDICGIEEQVKVCHRGAGKVADDTMGSTGVTRAGAGVTGKGTGVRRGPLTAMDSVVALVAAKMLLLSTSILRIA
jgi:hypothetical protein